MAGGHPYNIYKRRTLIRLFFECGDMAMNSRGVCVEYPYFPRIVVHVRILSKKMHENESISEVNR